MEKAVIKIGDNEIEKYKFSQNRKSVSMKKIDVDKIVSNKVSVGEKGFKYFIGYKDAKNIRPFCIFLPKMSAYRRDFDETIYIFFDKR